MKALTWLLLLVCTLFVRPALAVEPLSEPPLGDPITDPALLEAETLRIGAGLRCPVCQGMSVADSQTEIAVGMKNRISELLAQGYTQEQIEDHFIGVYTNWILLEPPAEGTNWLIFLAPLLLVLIGLFVVFMQRRITPEESAAELDSAIAEASQDPYRKRVLDELD